MSMETVATLKRISADDLAKMLREQPSGPSDESKVAVVDVRDDGMFFCLSASLIVLSWKKESVSLGKPLCGAHFHCRIKDHSDLTSTHLPRHQFRLILFDSIPQIPAQPANLGYSTNCQE